MCKQQQQQLYSTCISTLYVVEEGVLRLLDLVPRGRAAQLDGVHWQPAPNSQSVRVLQVVAMVGDLN